MATKGGATCRPIMRDLIAHRNLSIVHWPLTMPPDSAERKLHWPGVAKGLAHLKLFISGEDIW